MVVSIAASSARIALRSTSRTGGCVTRCSARVRTLSTQMTLNDFASFHVPQSLIAQSPAVPRDSSRLMVVRRETGTIEHHFFRDLPKLLDSSYLIVANNSRVVNCKLMPTYYETNNTIDGLTARESSNEKVEKVLVLYLLKQLQHDRWLVSGDAELESKSIGFKVYIPVDSVENSSSSVIVGTLVQIDDDGSLEMVFHSEDRNGCIISTETDIKKSLQSAASMPLPPYIEPENAMKVADQSYQTVYAVEDGSVAAPTAGLHFTPEVFAALEAKGVGRVEITLHVGYGTFGHVTENNLSNHKMHSENYTLSEEVTTAINNHKKLSSKNKVLTVGTTSTRVLESCAALTAGHRNGGSAATSTSECSNTSRHELISGSGETNIFIYPPYQFKMVDALLTNFHMPGLTPVMLVSSFAGHSLTMKAYEEAVKEKYRFYSFGDSMLIL